MSDSCNPNGLEPARLLCSWDSLSKNTVVGCHFSFSMFHGWIIIILSWLTVCFLHFLTSLIKFILWRFSADKRRTEIMGGGLFWEGLEGSCSVAQVGKCGSWPKGRLWQLKDKWTLSGIPLTKMWCLCPFPLIWAGLMFTVICDGGNTLSIPGQALKGLEVSVLLGPEQPCNKSHCPARETMERESFTECCLPTVSPSPVLHTKGAVGGGCHRPNRHVVPKLCTEAGISNVMIQEVRPLRGN